MCSGVNTLHLNYSGIRQLTHSDLQQDAYKKANRLYLKRNLIKQLPSTIGQLTSLAELHVDCNELESLPDEIGDLHSLETLNVSANRLETLPGTIGNLQNLRKLSISDNRLTNIPKELGQLHKLVTLEASRNLITTLPTELSLCGNLSLLALDKNQLTCLPRQLGNLKKLTELSACGNFLEYIPQAMAEMPSMRVLYLDNNPAFSTFPQKLAFSGFREIGLHGCFQVDAVLNERFHHIYVDDRPIAVPEEIYQVCSPGSDCVPSLQELAMRAISGHVKNGKDMEYLPLPDQFKKRLSDPSAYCDKCETCLFTSAFPAVFVNFYANRNVLALLCSLKCVDTFFIGFKMVYPYNKSSVFLWNP